MNETTLGISVGIKEGNTTTWYCAHSLNRQPKGGMVAFAYNDERTPVSIPLRKFAGVFGHRTDGLGTDRCITEARL